tara:strand:+ start:127 stop:630 length:504 start_codon:yes stop_codon:yes gene_type:complete
MAYNASPTFFTDLTADGLRRTETEIATIGWESGGNAGASNAHGVGINIDGGELPAETNFNSVGMNWTLLDQKEVTRTPQVSQVIGGFGFVPRSGDVATTWDTTQPSYTPEGAASSGGVSGNGQVASPETIATATNQADSGNAPVYDAYPTIDGQASLPALTGWVSVT